jgi:HAD superfamily hydrolase (TIGR01509 family)
VSGIDAVVFDLDGVIVDSEQVWDEVRERFVRESGGTYTDAATRAMMGMSSPEWSAYLVDDLGVPMTPEEANAEVVRRMLERYGEAPPLIPGAVDAVRRIGARWPLAIASSANRELIDVVVAAAGLGDLIRVSVSSEEVGRGKPAPDVYLEVSRRLGVSATHCAAVEDSTNGLLAARAAGMRVVAVPRAAFPPDPEVLATADAVVPDLSGLAVGVIDPRR